MKIRETIWALTDLSELCVDAQQTEKKKIMLIPIQLILGKFINSISMAFFSESNIFFGMINVEQYILIYNNAIVYPMDSYIL